MMSFKNKKAGRLRILVKEIAQSVVPCSQVKSSRNVYMCLYVSGGAALVKMLWYACMKYRALEEPSDITITVRKQGYIVLLESTEIFEFCVVSMKIPNSRSRYQDIICTANVNTRNERCEKKRSIFLSSAKSH